MLCTVLLFPKKPNVSWIVLMKLEFFSHLCIEIYFLYLFFSNYSDFFFHSIYFKPSIFVFWILYNFFRTFSIFLLFNFKAKNSRKLQIKQITQNRNGSDNISYSILTFNDKFGWCFDLTRRTGNTACEEARVFFICCCNQ